MKTVKRLLGILSLAAACSLGAGAQENQSYFLHTIEKGQSLYSIASMYGVSQADIIKLNPGSERKIYAGSKLRIPRGASNVQAQTYHTIEAGETLYRLTVKYNVSAKAICDANPGLSAQNFRIGQVILIPSAQEAAAADSHTADNNAAAATADNTSIQPAVQSNCRDMHRVEKKETVYSISHAYGITEAELIAANPELKGGTKIKKGSYLCIPYPTATKKQQPAAQTAPSDKELFNANQKSARRIGTIKAALILPLLPEGTAQSESARMVEYYEGFLMAMDSLKRTGTSIDLHTYHSGPATASLQGLLSKSEMKEMDIIFGPLYTQHIKPLADFADKQGIRLVIPFTSKDNTVYRNPSIYQINTPQSYLYSEVYDHFTRQFPKANVVFLKVNEKDNDKAEFTKGLEEELRSRSIPVQTLTGEPTPATLKAATRADRVNVFIPTSGS
ncbi:MAG: LysM peptidoglycan-binding domain-containing protein, partial [Prevotellaceae bacterium]|nr:LysM peptidoglycan-binding domain-containing protein [Prevotellaceae bacterium]